MAMPWDDYRWGSWLDSPTPDASDADMSGDEIPADSSGEREGSSDYDVLRRPAHAPYASAERPLPSREEGDLAPNWRSPRQEWLLPTKSRRRMRTRQRGLLWRQTVAALLVVGLFAVAAHLPGQLGGRVADYASRYLAEDQLTWDTLLNLVRRPQSTPVEQSSAFLAAVPPAQGTIVGWYGWRGGDPSGTSHFTPGVDMATAPAAPVYAAAAGTVVSSGIEDDLGQVIRVESDGDWTVRYGRLSQKVARTGQPVQAGMLIGYAAKTPTDRGATFYVEITHSGSPVDPIPLLNLVPGR